MKSKISAVLDPEITATPDESYLALLARYEAYRLASRKARLKADQESVTKITGDSPQTGGYPGAM